MKRTDAQQASVRARNLVREKYNDSCFPKIENARNSTYPIVYAKFATPMRGFGRLRIYGWRFAPPSLAQGLAQQVMGADALNTRRQRKDSLSACVGNVAEYCRHLQVLMNFAKTAQRGLSGHAVFVPSNDGSHCRPCLGPAV